MRHPPKGRSREWWKRQGEDKVPENQREGIGRDRNGWKCGSRVETRDRGSVKETHPRFLHTSVKEATQGPNIGRNGWNDRSYSLRTHKQQFSHSIYLACKKGPFTLPSNGLEMSSEEEENPCRKKQGCMRWMAVKPVSKERLKKKKNFHKRKLPFETIRQHMLCEQEVTAEQ